MHYRSNLAEARVVLRLHGFAQYKNSVPWDPPRWMFAYRHTSRVVTIEYPSDCKGTLPCVIIYEGVLYAFKGRMDNDMPFYDEAYVARDPVTEVHSEKEHYWDGCAPGEKGHNVQEEAERKKAIERVKSEAAATASAKGHA